RVELCDGHARDFTEVIGQPRESRGTMGEEKRGRRACALAELHLLAQSPVEVGGGGEEGRAGQLDGVRAPARSEGGRERRPQAQLAQPPRKGVVKGLLAGPGVPGIEARL